MKHLHPGKSVVEVFDLMAEQKSPVEAQIVFNFYRNMTLTNWIKLYQDKDAIFEDFSSVEYTPYIEHIDSAPTSLWHQFSLALQLLTICTLPYTKKCSLLEHTLSRLSSDEAEWFERFINKDLESKYPFMSKESIETDYKFLEL